MKNMKFWRTALVASLVLTVMLSVTGGTIAWFTDTVTAGENTIKTGNLEVVLQYKNDWDDQWAEVTKDTKLFDETALYEPGYTEVVYLRVANAGNLALKYQLGFDITNKIKGTSVLGNEIELSDYMQIGTYVMDEYSSNANYADILFPIMFGTRDQVIENVAFTELNDEDTVVVVNDRPVLVGEQTSQVIALALHMPTSVGNEANHVTGSIPPQMSINLNLLATQHTDEHDDFGNDYDAGAEYLPPVPSDLPKAEVTALSTDEPRTYQKVSFTNSGIQMGETKDIKMEALLNYKATESAAEVAESPYRYWNADFSVSVDRAVPAGVIGLAGEYGGMQFAFDITEELLSLIEADSTEIPADEAFRLLHGAGFDTNYEQICTDVVNFVCGVYFTDSATAEQKEAVKGTKMTVELRLYETIDPSTNNGKPSKVEVEPENSVVIGTYTHTF